MAKNGKRPKSDSDVNKLKEALREISRLRKQISSLRKQLSRTDVDNYQNVMELLNSHDKQNEQASEEQLVRKVEQKWKCNTCNIDSLRIFMLDRIDGMFYFRKCPNCNHKTRLKKLSSIVEGLNHNGEIVKYSNK